MTRDSFIRLIMGLPEDLDLSFTAWMAKVRKQWTKVVKADYDPRYLAPVSPEKVEEVLDATQIYQRLPEVWGLDEARQVSNGRLSTKTGLAWLAKLCVSRGWAEPAEAGKYRKTAGKYSRAKNELGFYLSGIQKWWEFSCADAAEVWDLSVGGASGRLTKLAQAGLVRRVDRVNWRRTSQSELYLRTWGVVETGLVPVAYADRRPKHCPLGSIEEIPAKGDTGTEDSLIQEAIEEVVKVPTWL